MDQTIDDSRSSAMTKPSDGYNYASFSPRMLMKDVKLVVSGGPEPGSIAPDFELANVDGGRIRLSDLRGQPVVLILGSVTCPMTRGSIPPLKKLYEREGDRGATWLVLYVREAHPGEHFSAHDAYEQKREQARALRDLEGLPWPVLVDDIDGTTHKAYGELPNSLYVVDADGRVAFKEQWAAAPPLHTALEELERLDGRGAPVAGGIRRMMHMTPTMAFGWQALERGGSQSVRDVITKAPPLAAMLALGRVLQPILRPLALRTRPIPRSLGVAVAAGMIVGLLAARAFRRA